MSRDTTAKTQSRDLPMVERNNALSQMTDRSNINDRYPNQNELLRMK